MYVCVVLQFIATPEDRSLPSLPVVPEGDISPSLPAAPNDSSQPPQNKEIDPTVSIQSSVSVRFLKPIFYKPHSIGFKSPQCHIRHTCPNQADNLVLRSHPQGSEKDLAYFEPFQLSSRYSPYVIRGCPLDLNWVICLPGEAGYSTELLTCDKLCMTLLRPDASPRWD